MKWYKVQPKGAMMKAKRACRLFGPLLFIFWIITNETGSGTFGWKVYSIVLILLVVAYLSGYLIRLDSNNQRY
jgi:hypothetical protein